MSVYLYLVTLHYCAKISLGGKRMKLKLDIVLHPRESWFSTLSWENMDKSDPRIWHSWEPFREPALADKWKTAMEECRAEL